MVTKYVWAGMILVGVSVGVVTGRLASIGDALLESASTAATICLSMLGIHALFMGMLGIASAAGIDKAVSRFFSFLLKRLFPDLKKDSPALGYIALNISANMFGMGNAATPFGLKAMAELQRENGGRQIASDAMCMFALLNTASVQLLPLSVLSLLAAAGSKNPAGIVAPVFLVTLATAVFAVLGGKLCRRRK